MPRVPANCTTCFHPEALHDGQGCVAGAGPGRTPCGCPGYEDPMLGRHLLALIFIILALVLIAVTAALLITRQPCPILLTPAAIGCAITALILMREKPYEHDR